MTPLHSLRNREFRKSDEVLLVSKFQDIVDAIFATSDRAEAESIIEYYSRYWMDIIGTRGFKGKKALSGRPMFDQFFDVADEEVDIESDDNVQLDETALDKLEQEQK